MAQWDADCEQARERSGQTALEAEHCAASAKLWDLVRLAAHTVARTPAGVLAKVAMAAALFGRDYFDITAERFAGKKEMSVEDFLLSAARDVAPGVFEGPEFLSASMNYRKPTGRRGDSAAGSWGGFRAAIFVCLASPLLLSWQLTVPPCGAIVPQPARCTAPRNVPAGLPRALTASGAGTFFNSRERAALFAARAVMEVTALLEALCLTKGIQWGWAAGVYEMSYHQRPHELRLAISSETEALISDFGGDAYVEACRRAEEASNDSLARDWGAVAGTIARRSDRRPSVLDALFG
jgi:hypothetical protein